jgi:hypothetical protein
MSIRRDVVAQVGESRDGVDRAGGRPFGCEETELCIRADAQWPDDEIAYQPRWVIRHRVPAERGTLSHFRSRCYAEGLSKAAVARIADSGRALSTERAYIATALRRGVTDGLRDGWRQTAFVDT